MSFTLGALGHSQDGNGGGGGNSIPIMTGHNYPPGEVVVKTVAHETGGQCLAFSPQGKKIATGGTDGKVKVYDKGLSHNCKWI